MENKNEYSLIAPYISADEFVRWKGKPGKARYFSKNDIMLIPFSIVWCGGVIFAFVSILRDGAPLFAYIFFIPFLIVAFFLSVGRFLVTKYYSNKTYYVITNKKIIRLRGKKIDMMDSKALPPMRIELHKNGNGTIRFSEIVYTRGGRGYNSYDSDPWINDRLAFSLDNIPNVAQVQQIINSMDK